MKVLLSARNAMGITADYEVEVSNADEIPAKLYILMGRPGIVAAWVSDNNKFTDS